MSKAFLAQVIQESAETTGVAAEVSVTPIRGGGSCEMFRVDRLGQAWVVRRAPLAAVSDTWVTVGEGA